ncbi:MAG: response regulator [Ktedonobacteraceae bacterium]|nr:response regulator [Ktedonobacteraceae bacterium]
MQLLKTPTLLDGIDDHSEHPLVLVIDDHAAVRDMLFWALQLWGYQPICVANGQEAMEWMESALSAGRYPAAILLDLLMPVVDGPKFLSAMRARWHAPLQPPPVVLLTVDKSNHTRLDCTDVLIKPFHLRDLCEILKFLTNQS